MSLQQKLDALRRHLQARTRSDALIAMLRVVEDAVSSDRAHSALGAASLAPNFTLPDEYDRPTSLRELLSTGPVVMVFYRGVWCPWCTQELEAMEAYSDRFKAHGASILAVSPQLPAYSRRCIRKHKLGFPIVHDAHGQIAAQFGVSWEIPTRLRDLYLGLDVDLARFNGSEGWVLPLPARYLVDQNRMIVYAEINASEPHRLDPAELLTALQSLPANAPFQ